MPIPHHCRTDNDTRPEPNGEVWPECAQGDIVHRAGAEHAQHFHALHSRHARREQAAVVLQRNVDWRIGAMQEVHDRRGIRPHEWIVVLEEPVQQSEQWCQNDQQAKQAPPTGCCAPEIAARLAGGSNGLHGGWRVANAGWMVAFFAFVVFQIVVFVAKKNVFPSFSTKMQK